MEKRVVAFSPDVLLVRQVGDITTEDAVFHVSVRRLLYNWLDNFIMRYNELSYHKASPFYKQDFLPDIAWLNRKPKQFPS
jgi:hypothetical protein